MITLQEFQERYLQYCQISHSKSTLKSVRYAFNNLLSFFDPATYLPNLTLQELEMFLLTSHKKTKYGAALFHRTLKAAFNKAIHWKLLEENYFRYIKLPKIPRKHPAFINKEQLQEILDNTTNIDLAHIWECAFHTGLRIGELLAVRWDHIDLEKKILIVKNSDEFTTKSKQERIIPINLPFYHILLKLSHKKINHPYVFRQYNKYYISHSFRKVVDKVGLSKDVHLHSLRHSFASNLVNKGASLYVVKELMGHADYKTTQIYAHLQQEVLIDAVALLN